MNFTIHEMFNLSKTIKKNFVVKIYSIYIFCIFLPVAFSAKGSDLAVMLLECVVKYTVNLSLFFILSDNSTSISIFSFSLFC